MKLNKFLKSASVNFVIIGMLAFLGTLSFNNELKSVFSPNNSNVYYNGNTSQNNISLMINVYWGNEYIDEILKVFDKYEAKTTFFVGGMWVSKYPELLIEINNHGHQIANHGYFHKSQDKLSYIENQQEIFNTHKIVRQYLDMNMNLFAPPSGAYNQNTLKAANDLGYSVIMWTKDTIDWRDKDADLIFKRATNKLSSGDLVLMHPTLHTLNALPNILQYCKNNNLNVVPVSLTIEN